MLIRTSKRTFCFRIMAISMWLGSSPSEVAHGIGVHDSVLSTTYHVTFTT